MPLVKVDTLERYHIPDRLPSAISTSGGAAASSSIIYWSIYTDGSYKNNICPHPQYINQNQDPNTHPPPPQYRGQRNRYNPASYTDHHDQRHHNSNKAACHTRNPRFDHVAGYGVFIDTNSEGEQSYGIAKKVDLEPFFQFKRPSAAIMQAGAPAGKKNQRIFQDDANKDELLLLEAGHTSLPESVGGDILLLELLAIEHALRHLVELQRAAGCCKHKGAEERGQADQHEVSIYVDSLLALRFIRWYARDPSLSSIWLRTGERRRYSYSPSDRALIRAVLVPVLSSIVGLCDSELLQHHHITLRKVKAHCGIRGNEIADWLAKTGRNLLRQHHQLNIPVPVIHPPQHYHHHRPTNPCSASAAAAAAGGQYCKVFSGNDQLLKAYNCSFRFHTHKYSNNNNIACTA